MALFGSKKKDTKKASSAKAVAPQKEKAVAAAPKEKAVVAVGLKEVLVRPRVTEKAANMTSQNVYTFDVVKSATKKEVKEAVQKLYKVTPIKVAVVNTKGKRVRLKTRRGFGKSAAYRKAYVFLKAGEQINLG